MRALGKLDDPRAIEVLLRDLKNNDVKIRLRSVYGLGGSKDPRAIEALIGALGDKGKLVKGNAAWQLKRITGQDFGKKQKKWQKWWEENKEKYLRKEK